MIRKGNQIVVVCFANTVKTAKYRRQHLRMQNMAKVLPDTVPSKNDCLNLAASAMRKGGRRGGKKQDDEVAIVTCPGCVQSPFLF